MAYTFSNNTIPATAAYAIYLLCSTMVSAGWAIKGSGDGGAFYDSTGGTAVTSGATGAHGLDVSSAWIRIQAPAVNGGSIVNQTREWTFQRSTTNNKGWRIKYSASAGFTGGSPSATVTPSATDEVFMCGGGTDAAPTFTANWFSTDAAYKWNIACGGAAEFYSFNAFGFTSNSTTALNGIFMDVMATGSFPSSDVDPCVVYCSAAAIGYNAQSVFGQLGSALSTVTNPALARAWMGPVSAAGASTTSNNVNIGICPYGSTNAAVIGGVSTCGTNPFSLKDDMLPAIWARPGSSLAPAGYKGISTLFTLGSVQRQFLDTADVAGTRDRIFLGLALTTQFWAPWGGALVSI
jgi:hypothetical protein